MVRSPCVSVGRERAERVRRELLRAGLLRTDLRPRREGERVLFPVTDPGALGGLLGDLGAELTWSEFEEVPRRPRSLREAVEGIPEELLNEVPSSFDVVGDIAVIHIPPALEPYAAELGRAVLKMSPSIRVVLGEAGPVSGEFRTREYVHLAGERRTHTVHRENGCVFEVDLARAYFSPRLSGERSRVVSMVREGERVLDMFSGVGPFAIQIARHRGVPVTAVELNPDAYRFLVRNVALNRVERLVEAVNEDARRVAASRPSAYDRVIMNHPSASLEFLREAMIAAREGATLHVYGFASSVADWEWKVRSRLEELGRVPSGLTVRKVREVSASRIIAVADVTL
ncbi:MAG: class I SAM-dependent methyltransferase family protein [Nitrososphaerota archaeon]|nr:class I SAM-dependent methyltransferase family protein [Candidatus Calditenuis fumarioli]